jgi:hypothetical protein
MVTTPTRSGHRTRLIGLLAQKFFSGLYVAKDKNETQALARGLSKGKAREKIACQRPQTTLLNQGAGHKMVMYD